MQQTMHWLKENENTILNGIDAAFITTLATILVIARCFPGIGPAFDKIATVMTNLWNGATITAMVGILPAALQHGISRLEWLRLTIDFSSTALLAANITLQIVSWAGVVVAPFIQPLTNAISSWCDTASYSISYYEAWRKGEDTTAISASLKKSVCLAVGATFITAGLIIASVVSHGALPMVFLAAKMCIAAAGLFASQALSASKPAVETKDSTLTLEENIKPAVSSTVTATPIVNNMPSTFSSIKYSVKDSVYRFFDRKYAQSSETLVSTIKPIATPMAAAS